MAYVTTGYAASGGQIIMHSSLYGRRFRCVLQVLSQDIYLRGLRKTMNTINRNNPSLGRHFEMRISEYVMRPLYHNEWLQIRHSAPIERCTRWLQVVLAVPVCEAGTSSLCLVSCLHFHENYLYRKSSRNIFCTLFQLDVVIGLWLCEAVRLAEHNSVSDRVISKRIIM